MNLTREQTSLIEQGRNLDFWRLLDSLLSEEDECENDLYLKIDDEYQKLEDEIETVGEVTGINAAGESYTIVPYTDRKPPITRPKFPF